MYKAGKTILSLSLFSHCAVVFKYIFFGLLSFIIIIIIIINIIIIVFKLIPSVKKVILMYFKYGIVLIYSIFVWLPKQFVSFMRFAI